MFIAGLLATPLSAAAMGEPPLLDAPWRAFDVADYPEYYPVAIDHGDVDGDGDVDVVAARFYHFQGGLAVLRNNGDGSYAAEELYNLPTQLPCGDVALADIDGDGDLDAICSVPGNSGVDSRIALWRNNGDGTFGAHRFFNAGPGPMGIVIADFNGDGFPDVATADNGYVAGDDSTISILRHNGLSGAQAGFLAPVSFAVGDNCLQLDAGDIDGDGDLDLAVGRTSYAGGDNGINVLQNDGSANFTVIASFAAWPGAYRSSAAVKFDDIDNDGDLDLVTGGADVNTPNRAHLVVRSNDGTGDFSAYQEYQMSDWSFTPWAIDTADLNGDGWRDIMFANPSGRTHDGWEVLMSNGAGGFHAPRFYEAAKWTQDVVAFDADGDGDEDVVTLGNDSSVITVHSNRGGGEFLVLPRHEVAGLVFTGMETGDIDHDGDPDIITFAEQISILVNRGDATFLPRQIFQPPFAVGHGVLRDMNGDGNDDLLMATAPCCPPYDFGVALGRGDGTFMPGVRIPVGGSQGGQIDAFDFDNDGDLDVVLTDPGPASRIYIAENHGSGTSFTVRIGVNMGGSFLGGGDFNHDGNIDFVSATALGLTLFPGNGDLTFGDEIPTGEDAYRFTVGDLNGDGHLDLAMIRPQDSFGSVYAAVAYGYGDGGFEFGIETIGPNGAEGAYRITSDIDAADLNGDGVGDVVFTSNAPNDISVFLGQLSGPLSDHQRFGAGIFAQFSTIADYNLDGILDVATLIHIEPGGFTDMVVVLKGTGAGQSEPGDANLINVSIITGSIISGGLPELNASDDLSLQTRSGFGSNFVDLHHMEAVVSAVTALDNASTLDVTVESRINQPAGTGLLRLRNWNTGQFVQVGQIASTRPTSFIRSPASTRPTT